MKKKGQRVKYSFVKIMSNSDLMWRRLPLMVIESSIPGPRVWLTACLHGDEVGGIVVIHEIFKRLKKIPLEKGSIYSFPLMNPLGFETSSRYITMTDEDLNRSFPGSEIGSFAERIANKIFSTIINTEPEVVLDLHTDWIKSIPYVLIDPISSINNKELLHKTIMLGKSSGFAIIEDSDTIKQTLTFCLLKHGIAALTIELGESYIVNEKNIQSGVQAILNILASLKMIAPVDEYFEHPSSQQFNNQLLVYSENPLCSKYGLMRFLVKPGDIVNQDQPIAHIHNAFGKILEVVRAEAKGIVLGHTDYSVAFPGKPVMSFGVIKNIQEKCNNGKNNQKK